MEKFKKVLKKMFFVPGKIGVPVVLLAIILLVYVFVKGLEESAFSYFVYVLSFYALCIFSVKIPKIIKGTKSFLHRNAYTAKYLSEAELRLKIALYNGTLISFLYGVFKLAMGIYFRSFWFGAVAVYYIVLCVIRYLLVKNEKKSINFEVKEEQRLHEWKSYRLSGILLLLLNVAISIITVRVVLRNDGYSYPDFVIYAAAAFTFYRVSVSIVRFVKKSKNLRPVFAAARSLDLSIALMSLFSLQTAMFSSFGGDMSEKTKMMMNSATGFGVCICVVSIAIYMIVNSTNKIRKENANGK